MISISNSLGAREQTAVDCIHNRRGANHATSKETTIEALDCIFASLDFVEFEIYIAFCVWVEGNMNNVAIFFFGFLSNVILKFLDPGFTFFPIFCVRHMYRSRMVTGNNILRGVKHVVQNDTATCHVYLDR